MRFKGLDLNLLVVFDALMNTRSVSRTAEQLNLSQPAISSALRRLRSYFGDDILAGHGKRMFPTPHAETILPQVKESLRIIEGLIATSSGFDPASSHRTFRICSSDYFATAVLAPLSRRLAKDAPDVRLEFIPNDQPSWRLLKQGEIDVVIMPEDYSDQQFPAEHLLDEDYVVVGCARNPLFPDKLDEAAFRDAGHIQVALGNARTLVFSDRFLDTIAKDRRIEATAASFTVVPWLLMGTQRLALMQERLAETMKRHYPIATAPIPFDFPTMPVVVQYHAARVADPGLCWLRAQLRAECQKPVEVARVSEKERA